MKRDGSFPPKMFIKKYYCDGTLIFNIPFLLGLGHFAFWGLNFENIHII